VFEDIVVEFVFEDTLVEALSVCAVLVSVPVPDVTLFVVSVEDDETEFT